MDWIGLDWIGWRRNINPFLCVYFGVRRSVALPVPSRRVHEIINIRLAKIDC